MEQIFDDFYKWLNQQYKEMIQIEKIQSCPWFLWGSPSALIYLWIIFMCDIILDNKYSADIERSFVQSSAISSVAQKVYLHIKPDIKTVY